MLLLLLVFLMPTVLMPRTLTAASSAGAAGAGAAQGVLRHLRTHTMATPMMTTAMEPSTGAEKRLRMYSSSTTHTNGMISSLAICGVAAHQKDAQLFTPGWYGAPHAAAAVH
eukprot:GHRQ01014149.1.p3 GENE.GHRQ01014149.1~~GHRQ01014149.1.p3  ORF type:complete len:112 (+),score=42.06 GHRQ01014149.1:110-445(+)